MSKARMGTAVITGASTGIGAVYAKRLAQRGYDLILIARNHDRLIIVAEMVAKQTGVHIDVIAADLTRDSDLRIVEKTLKADKSITMLVNNAGVGATTSLLESDIEKMQEILALNVSALTRLTYAITPQFASRGKGTIINISSIVAVAPEVLNGVYGASKSYVLAFSQSLKHELEEKGVRVQVVLPGATSTGIWEIAGMPIGNLPKDIVMTAEDMVEAALAGLENGEFITIPALEDLRRWEKYEAARLAMRPHLSQTVPASRYAIKT